MRWEVIFHLLSGVEVHSLKSGASFECVKTHAMRVFRRLTKEGDRIARVAIRELEEGGSVYIRRISEAGKPQSSWSFGGRYE